MNDKIAQFDGLLLGWFQRISNRAYALIGWDSFALGKAVFAVVAGTMIFQAPSVVRNVDGLSGESLAGSRVACFLAVLVASGFYIYHNGEADRLREETIRAAEGRTRNPLASDYGTRVRFLAIMSLFVFPVGAAVYASAPVGTHAFALIGLLLMGLAVSWTLWEYFAACDLPPSSKSLLKRGIEWLRRTLVPAFAPVPSS